MEWFKFADPQRLWILLIVPVVIIGYVIALKRKHRVGMRYPNTTLLGRVATKQSQWRRHLAVALSLLSLIALSVAWARPQGVESVPRERATVVLVIDISMSMEATDVKPSRLEAEKTAALEFLDTLPAKFNVAVVSLSGSPAVRLSPTLDRNQAKQAIRTLKVQESTAIGESIYVGLSAIKMAPKGDSGKAAPGAIILLSDGQNTAGRAPVQAAAAALSDKVPVYTVAYGTDNGYVDLDGKRQAVPPDRELLTKIAQISKAKSYSATDLSQLRRVYEGLRSEVGWMPVEKEVTAQWAGYGLAFAVLAALAAVSLGARWP
ncbi:MAG: VWA domain-containing protein [Propionicimonas sp.]